jgi:hypothetical protein
MKVNFNQYLVIDKTQNVNSLKQRDGSYRYTVTGPSIYPIGEIVPLIRKGDNCLGLIKIESIVITANSTSVNFNIVEAKGDYTAIYNLYRNQITNSSNSDDPYDNDDVIIPGAYQRGKSATTNDKSTLFEDLDDVEDNDDDSDNDIFNMFFGKDRLKSL